MSSGLRNCCRHVYEEKNSQVFSSLRYLCLGWQYHQEEEQPRCHNCQSKWQVKRLDLFSRRKYLSTKRQNFICGVSIVSVVVNIGIAFCHIWIFIDIFCLHCFNW